MKFSENLRFLLEESNITQKQLATIINVAPSTVGNYIQGKTEPDLTTLVSLSNALNVSVDLLLGKVSSADRSIDEDYLVRLFRQADVKNQKIILEVTRTISQLK